MAVDTKLNMDTKLNIGVSLYNSVPDFLNIGIECESEFGSIIEKNNIRFLKQDVTQGLPLDSDSIEFIYTSHFVEHLSIKDFYSFIKECYRVLKPAGVLRIVCPDLQKWMDAYLNKDNVFFENYHNILKENHKKPWCSVDYNYVLSPADFLMCNIHNWNHKWAFDLESITLHLKKCGFATVINTGYRNSIYTEISKIEPQFHQVESLYIEVQKC